MHSKFDDDGRYIKFNVRNEFQHIDLKNSFRKNEIMIFIERYLQSQNVFKVIKRCANSLTKRECASLFV